MIRKVARKCFISYHASDKAAVDKFLSDFKGNFIHRGSDMDGDIINSTNTDYVMSRIRDRFLEDSTVTILLVGRCTWARKYVDWELQSSLRQPENGNPNGLVAIQIDINAFKLPDRAQLNRDSGYMKFYKYPVSSASLENMIEEAFNARTKHSNKIVNRRDRYTINRQCH